MFMYIRMSKNCWVLVAVLLSIIRVADGVSELRCYDWKGDPVLDGVEFVPHREDPCHTCTCDAGFPVMCTSVMCSAPECTGSKRARPVEGECCKFTCIEGSEMPDRGGDGRNKTVGLVPEYTDTVEAVDTANLGLKLVASTVTSFLILALLLFMVHRLRQRRLLIMRRRMHAAQAEDSVAYMTQFDQVDMMGIEFPPYVEPPPPYTPPKPPDYPSEEGPPPYTPENNNNEGEGRIPLRPSGGFMRGGRTVLGVVPLVNGMSPPYPGPSVQGAYIPASPTAIPPDALGYLPPDVLGHAPPGYAPPGMHEAMTPDSEADSSYGLSSPYIDSRPPLGNVSRFQNSEELPNTSQSVSTGTSTEGNESMNQSHNDSANSDTLVKKSHPQMQFIKRSNSVEIKRGSSSPRNSYVGVIEGACDSPTPRKQLNDSAESGTPSSGAQSVDSPVLERSPLLKPDQCSPRGADVSVTWTRGSKPFRIPLNASCAVGTTSPETRNTSVSTACRRSPPQSLPLVPLAQQGAACSSSASTGAVGVATNDRDLCEISPVHSRPVLHSPLTPTAGAQAVPRSGSIASQVSQFSVCSETGEKKRPKFSVVPIAIENDSPYPISQMSGALPGPSNYYGGPSNQSDGHGNKRSDPSNHHSGPSNQSSVDSGVPPSSRTPTSSSNSSAASSPLIESDTLMASATSPSAASDSASALDSRQSTLDRPKLKAAKLTNGALVNGDVIDHLSAINNNQVGAGAPPARDGVVTSRGNKPERSNSHKSERETVNGGSEKSTTHKGKQKKRKSKDTGTSGEVMPVRISYINDEADGAYVQGADATERRRRSSRGRDATSPKFKQYGFIDQPQALMNGQTAQQSNRSLQRQNSKEKPRDHRKNGSRHNSTERDKSRENSRERRPRSWSRDRNIHKNVDNDTACDFNLGAPERTLDNAAFMNKDKEENRRRRSKNHRDHTATSSSIDRRRKRRSTGDRTFPEAQTQGQGYKHSQTSPALNGHHENADDVVVVDNDDDVFINTHSNETIDNIHHHQNRRGKTRLNRHSVPTLDNRSQYLDR